MPCSVKQRSTERIITAIKPSTARFVEVQPVRQRHRVRATIAEDVDWTLTTVLSVCRLSVHLRTSDSRSSDRASPQAARPTDGKWSRLTATR